MSKLLTVYSSSTGLKISKPYLMENFYPVIYDKYVTFQSGSAMAAKCYDYWNEVILLIKKYLDANKIGVVLLGSKDDPLIPHTHDLRGITLNQCYYVQRRALMHFGGDSCFAHFAGALGKPIVEIFGPTTPHNHGPYFYDKEKTIFIESHRCGKKPSFSNQESPKSINFIKPEEIANSILSLLGVEDRIDIKTTYVGPIYNNILLEYVPDDVYPDGLAPGSAIIVRMDYNFDEKRLEEVSNKRPIHIITDKEINIDLLKSIKPRIIGINYEVSESSNPEYLKQINALGVRTLFFAKEDDEKKLANIRFKLFEVGLIEKMNTHRKENFIYDSKEYLHDFSLDPMQNLDNMYYKSKKFLVSGGKIYISKAAWKRGVPTQSIDNVSQKVIDSPEFWDEMEHFYIYEQPRNT